MCQMKIYKALHLCRTNRRIFKRVRNNSNRDVNHAAAYCFQLRSNVRHQNHFWIRASIRPYSRDSINPAFFRKFDCDFGKFSTKPSVTRQSILIILPTFSPQQIRAALHDFEFDGVAVLSFFNYESRNRPMAIDHAVYIVCRPTGCVGVPLLDIVSAILSRTHHVRVGRYGRYHVQHIVGAADVHIGRAVQSTRSL